MCKFTCWSARSRKTCICTGMGNRGTSGSGGVKFEPIFLPLYSSLICMMLIFICFAHVASCAAGSCGLNNCNPGGYIRSPEFLGCGETNCCCIGVTGMIEHRSDPNPCEFCYVKEGWYYPILNGGAFPCPAGTYKNWESKDIEGVSVCTPCSPGTYSNEGSSSCTICPEGTHSVLRSSKCTKCPDGSIFDFESGICKCPSPNMYYTNKTAGTCKIVPPGTMKVPGTEDQIQECAPGYKRSVEDDGYSCVECLSGMYADPHTLPPNVSHVKKENTRSTVQQSAMIIVQAGMTKCLVERVEYT